MRITAIYGSPRKDGNTDKLLKKFVQGVRDEGAEVVEFFLRDMNISPCREIYGCRKDGRCVIRDDFQIIADEMLKSNAIVVATPVFFYSVSAYTKAFIDRCQSLWVKKYWIDQVPFGKDEAKRLGVVISVGATSGKRLFDGILLTMRYFFDAVGAKLWATLFYRGLDDKDDVLNHPEYLQEAYAKGQELVRILREEKSGN